MSGLFRFGISIRWLMVVVAIVALFLSAEKMRRVWRERSLKATEYEAEANSWAKDVDSLERMMTTVRSRSDPASKKRLQDLEEFANNYRGHERSNRELAARYARAATRPWLAFEDNKPSPQ